MDVWCAELLEESELLEATPLDDLYPVPTHVTTDSSVLATVAEEQRGHLPTRGYPLDSDIAETYHVPLCSMDEDDTYGLDWEENGR
eukprot:374465-Pyramimonas_sp.AAC.2